MFFLSCKKSCEIKARVPEPLGAVNATTVDDVTHEKDAPRQGACYNNSREGESNVENACLHPWL